jgi:hypothetical protein
MKGLELNKKILEASQIGIEFEFYTLMDKKEMVKILEKETGKKIK